jgi:paraquat-inducible protein A
MQLTDSEISDLTIKKEPSISDLSHQNVANLVCCEECDVVYQRVDLKKGAKAYCLRCGAVLYKNGRSIQQLLPLVIASFILFIISNVFPIVKIDLKGNFAETTLLGAVNAMFDADRGFVAILVFLTTFAFPLCEMLLLIYILVPTTIWKIQPQGMAFALRVIKVFRVWGMIEVFLIGVLVTLVKLAVMVVIIPGIALWSFAALTILLVLVMSVSVSEIWVQVEDCEHIS